MVPPSSIMQTYLEKLTFIYLFAKVLSTFIVTKLTCGLVPSSLTGWLATRSTHS